MTRHCIHRNLFGQCDNRQCGYRGPCDGIEHTEFQDEEKVLRASPVQIGGGDCCSYFQPQEEQK